MEKKKNNAEKKAEKAKLVNKSQKNKKANKKDMSNSPSQENKTNERQQMSNKEQLKAQKHQRKMELKKQKEQKRRKRLEIKEQKKLEREKVRAEKQKANAQKRIELAKIKAHKKAEKQKAKMTLLRDKQRRKQERKEKREALKKERLEKRQMLKSQTKQEKRERKDAERKARRQAKLQKTQERKQRKRERQKRRDENKGYGGWLAAVISLGVATLVLASVLTFSLLMPTTTDNLMELSYQKSFYDTVEQVDNIDLNLSKALASKDAMAVEQYLIDTAINSELAENDIQQLPLHDESKYYTTKLINQIGDYSKYLVNKLINGQPLTSVDKQNLQSLYSANLELKNALQQMMKETNGNYSFSSLAKAKSGDILIEGFTKLQNLSVEYPELIYDGPFSDGQDQRAIKGLSKEQVTFDIAKENFIKIFKGYDLKNIKSSGQTDGDIVCYNIQAEVDDSLLYAQISKNDGKLIMFSMAGSCESAIVDEDTAIENAEQFLSNMGLTDMQEVWMNISNNVYTFNFAKTQNGIILYPDLVKVRVCAETGKVIGIEAKSYYTNHTTRSLSSASLSQSQAKKSVFDDMQIKGARLVVVPVGNTSEKLCYEFFGEFDGQTYYVYIDANNGRQVEMFKVVEGTEGAYLM